VATIYYIILVPMVYAAFTVFVFGTGFRLLIFWREPMRSPRMPIYPSRRPRLLWTLYDTFLLPTVRRHNPVFWFFLMLFHLSFLLLIIGHLELIDGYRWIQIIPHEIFLGNGFIGLILSVCLLFFLFRRFASPNRDLSVPEDYYLLILLFLTVLFGSQMDWARRWYDYGNLSITEYRNYLQSLLHLRPVLSPDLTTPGHSFMLVLHIFFANLFLIFFPFSQLMHAFLSFALNRLRRG
jgi:nitrate reductase gamma subunit